MALPAGVVGRERAPLRNRVGAARRWSHQFYAAVTLFLFGVVVKGFWPTYFGTLLSGGVSRPLVMHVHGAVFTGWMALLALQVALAATGRVRAHRRIGTFGIGYGIAILVMGIVATFVAPVIHVRAGEWTADQAAAFLILPIGDMVLWTGLFGAAVAYRAKPEIHKRLIIAATVALAFAAVARMNFPLPIFFAIWLLPMVALAIFDLTSTGKVHRVSAICTAVLILAALRVLVMETEPWLAIGRRLLSAFL